MQNWDSHAKDYVESMWKIMQYKKADDWVISTNTDMSVKNFINKCSNKLGIKLVWKHQGLNEVGIDSKTNKVIIKINKKYFRPGEIDFLKGDYSKARKLLNWKPRYSTDLLIDDMIEYEKNLTNKYFYPLIEDPFSNKDISEGIKVLKSKQLTISTKTSQFEKAFTNTIKTNYSLMVNSGSSANLLAFQCLINPYRRIRLNKGDEVIIPTLAWSTSLWPIVQSNLKPVFVDINPDTLKID